MKADLEKLSILHKEILDLIIQEKFDTLESKFIECAGVISTVKEFFKESSEEIQEKNNEDIDFLKEKIALIEERIENLENIKKPSMQVEYIGEEAGVWD